eukprot:4264695-Pyramimonas_sp.AAC.1
MLKAGMTVCCDCSCDCSCATALRPQEMLGAERARSRDHEAMRAQLDAKVGQLASRVEAMAEKELRLMQRLTEVTQQ